MVLPPSANGRSVEAGWVIGWWSDYRKSPLPQSAHDLAELEATSVAHRSFQWMYVPGLLQTPEY
ncbi:Scr1 family TA system antitoxin-like transcriptional regulator, partial [Streptomyces antimycoticus]